MLIETGFTLARPLDESWALLTDLERVAPAMPGVTVESSDADGLHAVMRVKVGPVTASYRTVVSIVSLDEAARTAVLRASGKETRGPGTVDATVTAQMAPEGDAATAVALSTDLAVTGKMAQFGGGVMTEVAEKLLRQFADQLEEQLAAPAPTPPTEADGSAPPIQAEPVDLGRLAGSAVLPKAAPALVAIGLALLALVLLRRRK
jgi:carbon monoxide dehydrogenase subunit G